ncbi:MAG: hypothetical protein DWI65_04075 [Candidatus Limnocylindrus sp. ZSMar2m-chloro-G89]|nr:MAG: hypothetical protein DWI65_04075 [Candidatus Limnocylindrus sp. ZSMar2m-chloro-G89]
MRSASLIAALLLVAACGGGTPASPSTSESGAPQSTRNGCIGEWPVAGKATSSGPIPLLANSDLAPGENRLLLSLVDADGFPLGGLGWKLRAETFNLTADGCVPIATNIEIPFTWSIKEIRGFFIGPAEIPAGTEELGLSINGTDATGAAVSIRFAAPVWPEGIALRPGDAAPTGATPTAATSEHGLAGISTDPSPLARLYKYSAADLLAAGTPFVMVFASPAFCVSQACGPTMDVIKAAAERHPGALIIHVEPYIMEWNGERMIPTLDANMRLQANGAASAWKLPVEPWIYVVDSNGIVSHSFEGVIGAAELDAAIKEIDAD